VKTNYFCFIKEKNKNGLTPNFGLGFNGPQNGAEWQKVG
jgi:hypothetical protein